MATNLGQTSGTVGRTVVDVSGIVDHAVRRCGVLPSLITSEQLESARDNLFFILSGLATRGLSLWCVKKIGLVLGSRNAVYALPSGTVDVLNAVLSPGSVAEAVTEAAGPGTPNGDLRATFSSPVSLVAVQGYPLFLPANFPNGAPTSFLCEVQYFLDGVGWVNYADLEVSLPAEFVTGASVVVLLPEQAWASATSWRVFSLQTGVEFITVAFGAGNFFANTRDIVMGKMSRDAFVSLPDKSAQTETPLQFWFDKQAFRPEVTLWPRPATTVLMTLYTQRQIQDPGGYTNAIDVPQRWLDAIIAMLAPRVCLELPKELVPPERYDKLTALAEKTLREAEDSETDGAPVRFAPRIGCYTR